MSDLMTGAAIALVFVSLIGWMAANARAAKLQTRADELSERLMRRAGEHE